MKIALVTCQAQLDLYGGEKLLISALSGLGHDVAIPVWDDAKVVWSEFDAVVLRCTWDYHQKLAQFHVWMDALESRQVCVINPLSILRWNINKRYLFEMAKHTAAVIPTCLIEPSDTRSLAQMMEALAVKEAVLKPLQSAAAWRTIRVLADDIVKAEDQFAHWRGEQEFLLQAFMPEVVDEGEWSLMFFNGVYSHSVLKRAKHGDFRVQSDHGGTVHALECPMHLQVQAQAMLAQLEHTPCYARLDAVVRGDALYLMELELIEPELFLEHHPEAAQRCARAIIQYAMSHKLGIAQRL